VTRIGLILIVLLSEHGFLLSQHLDYTIDQFTTEQGLPQNSVKTLAIDSMNQLWIGTEFGLVCYNGNTFRTIKSNYLSPRIARLFEARNQLWAMDGNSQVAHINIRDKSLTPKSQSINGSYTIKLLEEITNISGNILYQNIPVRDEYISNDILISSGLDHIFLVEYDKQAYAIEKTKKIILPGATQVIRKYLVCGHLLVLNRDGIVYAYNENTYARQSIKTVQIEGHRMDIGSFLNKANLFNGNNYAVYDNTIYKISISDGTIICTPMIKHLPPMNDIFSFLYIERLNLYIIGSGSDGLFIIRPKVFYTRKYVAYASHSDYTTNNIISVNNTYNISYLENGDVLTQNGILHPKNERIPSHFISTNRFQEIFQMVNKERSDILLFKLVAKDADGNIWTQNANQKQLLKSNSSFTKFERYSLPNPRFMNSIVEIGKNHYIFSDKETLFELKDQKIICSPEEKITPNGLQINGLYPYDKEKILLLTNKGIYINDYRKHLLWRNPHIPKNNFRSAYKMKSGKLLLGSYGDGYYVYDGLRCMALPVDKKQYLLTTHCFVPDRKGFLWISTNNGLFQVLESDIEAFANQKTKTIYYHYYDKSDGFLTNEFNGGCASPYSIAPDGQISLSSIKGIVQFYPDSIRPLLPTSPIYLTHISTSDAIYHFVSDSIELPSKSSIIQIEFESPYYGNKHNLHFEYRIIDRDSLWHSIDENKFSISDLGSGNYTIEIRKFIGFGYKNYMYKRIDLKIPKAYYEQWWFWLIVLNLLAIFIYIITQYRVYKTIREKEQLALIVSNKTEELLEKNKKLQQTLKLKDIMSSVMVHDISGPLKMLSNLSELALENKDNMSSKMVQDYIQEIHKATHGMYNYVYSVLGWLKYRDNKNISSETFSLFTLIDGLLPVKLKNNNSENEIIFYNEIPSNLLLHTQATILRIILTNILDNAYKYTKKGYIKIYHEIEYSSDYFMIHCEDTGKGLSEEAKKTIQNSLDSTPTNDNLKTIQLGYRIVTELLPLINGSLMIRSTLGKGTRITIKLPKSIIVS